MTKIKIDVVSDVMCPWCYVGKRRLEQAIAKIDDIDVEVRWQPFQLDPTLPPEGRDRKEYLESKFGGPDEAKRIYSSIENAGKAEGLEFQFEKIAVSPNTLDAHRVIRWADKVGDGIQDRLVEILFNQFFMEGQNIGDHGVLIRAAKQAGMDADIVKSLLAGDQDKQEVRKNIETAQKLGVRGVPCFILENKYAVMGAQEAATIEQAIRDMAKEASDAGAKEVTGA